MEMLDKIDFKKSDPQDMLKRIESFPSLIFGAYQVAKSYSLPAHYIKIKKVLMIGMGGSGAGGDILQNLLSETTGLTVQSCHSYEIPKFADHETLVIASSYSGNTEETLAGFITAHNAGAKLVAITTGGKLKILAEKFGAPLFLFDYPSPPRAAFPYLFTILLSVFIKLGAVEISDKDIDKSVELLESMVKKLGHDNSLFSNPAKILAQKILDKVPVLYATNHLIGVAARIKSQFNENSKNFAYFEELPELNHKSLLGIFNPKVKPFIISLESNFDNPRNLLRQNLTAEILQKNKVEIERIKFVQAKDWLSEQLLMVMFGDFLSYYLAILNKVDPTNQENVDYLKSRLT